MADIIIMLLYNVYNCAIDRNDIIGATGVWSSDMIDV